MKFEKAVIRGRDYLDMLDIQDHFAFTPNFGGDPKRSRFGSNEKMYQVELTEEDVAYIHDELGIKVSEWMPHVTDSNPNPTPVYSIKVSINYDHVDWYPVEIHLADNNGENDYILPESQTGKLDKIYDQEGFAKVDVRARIRYRKDDPGNATLYLSKAWFYQNVDEFTLAHQHNRTVSPEEEQPEALPFD